MRKEFLGANEVLIISADHDVERTFLCFVRTVHDGDFVTFHYNRHEDDRYVEETISVMEFIQRLIRHILEKHYKMIRYGGLYARHREMYEKVMSRSRGKRSSA